MDALQPHGIEAAHPDDFIFDLFDLYPAAVVQAAASHRQTLKNPPKSVDDYLDCLLKQRLTQTVDKLRQYKPML